MAKTKVGGDKAKVEFHYWRVVVTYDDGETSGNRVFKDREKAERWTERQRESPVVKKTMLESFVRRPYEERKVPKTPTPKASSK